AATTKSPLGSLLRPLRLDQRRAPSGGTGDHSEVGVGWPASTLGGAGFIGDDGAPVPGTDLIAACDAILPAMVERDPEWAGWCAGYHGRQWDSASSRRTSELRTMLGAVAAARPAAAKDVSMAGIVGTLGMLAEASGCAAILDPAAVPRPATATMGDWLTCFP